MTDTSELFSDKADLYAQSRPNYPDVLFAFIKSLTNTHNTAWDCATGNGQAAIGLAQIFDNVFATDISNVQISNHLDIENVTFSVSPAEHTEFADNMFDLVNVAQALHWFDFEKFWPEVRRVLKPGGAFITYGYDWFDGDPEINALIERKVKAVVAPYWAPQNQLLINGYRDVEFPFEYIDAPKIKLTLDWNLAQMMNYLHTWSATRRCMNDIGSAFFEDAQADIRKAWGDPLDVKTFTSSLVIIAGHPDRS